MSEDIFENTNNEMVYEITKALVTEFEKTACVIFDNKEDLERELLYILIPRYIDISMEYRVWIC